MVGILISSFMSLKFVPVRNAVIKAAMPKCVVSLAEIQNQLLLSTKLASRSTTRRLVAARAGVVAEATAAALDGLGLGDGDDVDGDGVEL